MTTGFYSFWALSMKLFAFVFAAAMPLSSAALSCSFEGAWPFQPDLEGWEPFAGDGEYLGDIPAPNVEVKEIQRGKEAPGMSCGDAGTLRLSVSLPDTTLYEIKDLGVYFRVVRGEDAYGIFPAIPLAGEANGNGYGILLAWLDGQPSEQNPINLELEVFFVSKGLQIGLPSVVTIHAD
ncbi:hypothetical protein N6L27_12175 [Leisingera sp. SS27]|uniref:hypothetical protein n=1 Tax=Leisingera sp. SS27 TaxID=2979462 RepID=UPI0023315166|nr:hypothetical protein [Leisingera sp. SS27]MDC0658758.1 hypothetical protein [Leisingera sp. SS27]